MRRVHLLVVALTGLSLGIFLITLLGYARVEIWLNELAAGDDPEAVEGGKEEGHPAPGAIVDGAGEDLLQETHPQRASVRSWWFRLSNRSMAARSILHLEGAAEPTA